MPMKLSYSAVYSFFRSVSHYPEATGYHVAGVKTTGFYTDCGLHLQRPPFHHGGYDATPLNSRKFGSTGVDGCHFSFLLTGRRWSVSSPVVMTLPAMLDNVIVGENFEEFLRLGLATRYDVLDDLALQPAKLLGQWPKPGEFAPWVDERAKEIQTEFAARFGLSPSRNPRRRLAELRRRYVPMLKSRGDRAP